MVRTEGQPGVRFCANVSGLIPSILCLCVILCAFLPFSVAWAQDEYTWMQIPGAAKDIGAGGGKVWVIGVSPNPPYGDNIFRWTGLTTGNPWEPISGAGTRIAVDGNGNAWVVNAQNNIYRFNGLGFQPIPGAATDIGVGGEKVWVIGVPNSNIFRWTGLTTGNPWALMSPLPGPGLADIAVDTSGAPWVVSDQNGIYGAFVAPTVMNKAAWPTPPDSMKVSCYTGPGDPPRYTQSPSNTCPVISYNGIDFWPFSYTDNRDSIGLVGYKSGTIVSQQELKGTRYVWQITVDNAAKTVTIWGQASRSVSTPWTNLR